MDPRQEALEWQERWRFMRNVAHQKVPRLSPSDLDDVAQEACLRLQRALAGPNEVTNLKGLMTTIAARAALDILARTRRPDRVGVVDVDLGIFPDPRSGGIDGPDVRTRVRFIVIEFFRQQRPECAKFVRKLFQGVTWAEVARQTGEREEAVRQRWSRNCLRLLRDRAPDIGLDQVFEDWSNTEDPW